MKSSYNLVILIALFFVQACEEPDCTSELNDTINLSFYKFTENEPDTVYINSLRAVGGGSELYSNEADVSKIVLPANPDTSAITFVFNIREYGIDTLTLTYKNGVRLISEECGTELVYTELGYVRHDFDSIRIVNTILAEAINENIRVYNN